MSFFSKKKKSRKLGKVSEQHSIHAKLSNIAYDSPDKRQGEVDGWKYDRELSNEENAVYHKDGKVIHSSRGTAVAKDLVSDAYIVAGRFDKSSRAKRSLENANQVVSKYGKGNVEYTGHSLGGQSSAFLARKLDGKATTFNAGAGLRSKANKRQGKSCRANPNQNVCKSTHYRTGFDAVSFMGLGAGGKTKKVKTKKASKLTKFLALGNPFLGAGAYVAESHLGSQFI